MNLADSSTLISTLLTRGFRRVPHITDADLIILNTCSVRVKAEERVFGRLGELASLKAKNPALKIAVVGCMAQRLGNELRERFPHVDYVLGTDREFELPDVISGNEVSSPVMTAFGHENIDLIQPVKQNLFSGFVTISRGCNNYCSYCIVPYVRGRERAHSIKQIIDSIKRMVDEGVLEVTLLGQNVNSYRYFDIDFPTLLQRVVSETSIQRVRFMTSHPKDFSRRLVDVIADEPRLMPHIHLPMQSGSNRILELMARGYTIEHYLAIIEYMKSRLDYVSITTDVIVGFPSETEYEYEQTLQAIRTVEFDAAFMFRYSVRPGTAAAHLEDDVLENEKIRRLNKLIALQHEIGFRRNQREVNQVRYSLVEGASRRDQGFLRARTEGNKTVLFKSENGIKTGVLVPIRIKSADAFTLHGEYGEVRS
jgi:tRNA-2-methylthio-N6-dimethylallyladenosine synthase